MATASLLDALAGEHIRRPAPSFQGQRFGHVRAASAPCAGPALSAGRFALGPWSAVDIGQLRCCADVTAGLATFSIDEAASSSSSCWGRSPDAAVDGTSIGVRRGDGPRGLKQYRSGQRSCGWQSSNLAMCSAIGNAVFRPWMTLPTTDGVTPKRRAMSRCFQPRRRRR